ncbi:MAG: phosphonate C-P lyase system protein PhnG [Candidatus Thiodiazotropha taylori]|nr:phosphonate C-P lyase system protein PhnG [Candidatus Thiodiazotropha taylori]MCG8079407.1 phosphonate C-P lyase system protein PhnG [Candidatus Thiodiazotropha taylori]MCG8107801.1 phosphonate C-P lyase system protein PhnG [Candidatus Thiodiazotropha taylori]MCG8111423.1 phosphonate C-P lyase system protein PhnG [Candidatus Thiodiazotropha taylori]MCW4280140.1 phosphonate C-P lyase system protein PhnG [Candidatus Thiodiazotropha taylori]
MTREEWVSVLTALPEKRLTELVKGFPADWKVQPTTLPQVGLGMMKVKESAFNESFYLGEFPLASCTVTVTTGSGESAAGGALVMDDRMERAEQLAVCDAVMTGRLPGWQKVEALLQEGSARREQISRERKAMLARTKVDFSLLEDVGSEDA